MFFPPLSSSLVKGYNNTFLIFLYFTSRFCIFQSTYGTFLLSINRFTSVLLPYGDYHNNKKLLLTFSPFYILLPLYFTWFILPSTILLVPIDKFFSDNYTTFVIGYIKPKFFTNGSVSQTLYPYLLTMGTIQLVLNLTTMIRLIIIKCKNQTNNPNSDNKQQYKLLIFTLTAFFFQICFVIQTKLIMLHLYDEDETISDYLEAFNIKLVSFQMGVTICGLVLMSKTLRDKIFVEIKYKKTSSIIINMKRNNNK